MELVHEADVALYQAKAEGRDRAIHASRIGASSAVAQAGGVKDAHVGVAAVGYRFKMPSKFARRAVAVAGFAFSSGGAARNPPGGSSRSCTSIIDFLTCSISSERSCCGRSSAAQLLKSSCGEVAVASCIDSNSRPASCCEFLFE